MSDASPRLALPFLLPSQAQKHVTHNEALARLDMLVQARALATAAVAPPPGPEAGALYALGAAPEGDWAGHAGELALWDGTGWSFAEAPEGMRLWDSAAQRLVIRVGGGWRPAAPTDQIDGLGVNTAHDATNRLAVRAAATLLSHEGGGHQLKINKAAPGDTASLLMQSDWTGHAEMGLTGGNDFAIKVSPDGGTWHEALRIAAASGTVTGAAVQAGPLDATPGRLMRADFGYSPANVVGPVGESGGQPTGAVIERGDSGAGRFTRFADGTLICWRAVAVDVASDGEQVFAFPAPFAAAPAVSVAQRSTAPHSALEMANIRAVTGRAGGDQHWALRLRAAGAPVDPASADEQLVLTATGRWV